MDYRKKAELDKAFAAVFSEEERSYFALSRERVAEQLAAEAMEKAAKARTVRRKKAGAAAGLVVVASAIGIVGYKIDASGQAGYERDQAIKAAAVRIVLGSPQELSLLGICPAELSQEAIDRPALATEYNRAALHLQIYDPDCAPSEKVAGISVPVTNKDPVDIAIADVLPDMY